MYVNSLSLSLGSRNTEVVVTHTSTSFGHRFSLLMHYSGNHLDIHVKFSKDLLRNGDVQTVNHNSQVEGSVESLI